MAYARWAEATSVVVIDSPPYYGMRTYIPDQWIRNWFVGGSPTTDYSADVISSIQKGFDDVRAGARAGVETFGHRAR